MQKFTTDCLNVYIQDGIMFVEFLKEHVDFEDVDLGIKKRIEMAEGKSFAMLSDITRGKSITREARQRMGEKDAGAGVKAVAIIVGSKIHEVLFNFFHSVYKSPAPAKLFTNKEKALKWLEQYK